MGRRLIVATMLATFSVSCLAGGPFSRRGRAAARRTTSKANTRSVASSYRHLMNSPEKLTEIFGPSILIRDEPQAKSRFVTQPAK